MNELPSTKFRATFHRLAEPTVVTVNGHAIGTWLPSSTPDWSEWLATHNASTGAPIIGGMATTRGVTVEAMAEEIAHLKRELARRSQPVAVPMSVDPVPANVPEFLRPSVRPNEPSFGTPRPAPKTRKAR